MADKKLQSREAPRRKAGIRSHGSLLNTYSWASSPEFQIQQDCEGVSLRICISNQVPFGDQNLGYSGIEVKRSLFEVRRIQIGN